MIKWIVILNNKVIDEVYFTSDCDKSYVRESLIQHDGYHPAIMVRKA